MQLSRLTQGLTLEDHIGQDVEITSLTCDTRNPLPRWPVCRLSRGENRRKPVDPAALAKGAVRFSATIPQRNWALAGFPQPPGRLRADGGQLVRPPRGPDDLVGVTGTNGKNHHDLPF